ncbi:MAG: pantoate--beta-alanine ligase [Pseudonocardiaceae bacterium]
MTGLAVHGDPAATSAATRSLRQAGRSVVLVPTMGALHDGHRSLIRAARALPDADTIVSIFVNPLQFDARADLDRYPRRLEADLAICREEGVALVFAPTVEAMYPPGSDTTVHPGPLGAELEGASRPGHFAGVLTVVATLFGILAPDRALFGEKDYQQLVLIQRMVADLRMDVQVAGLPTVRAADGLALSSRNVHLDPAARCAAAALPAALLAGVQDGGHGHDAVLTAARKVLAGHPAVTLDYLELRDPQLGPAPRRGPARLLLAATVGDTRLIDNMCVQLGFVDGGGEQQPGRDGQGGL